MPRFQSPNKTNKTTLKTPLGFLEISEENNCIISCRFATNSNLTYIPEQETKILKEAKKQIEEYFNKSRKTFNLPLKFNGTDFQQSIWNELTKIPYGKTCTYKELAEKTNHPKAYRAVGMACHRNPICIIVPCHRIIGNNNKLTGYAGGIEKKEKLLKLEQFYH